MKDALPLSLLNDFLYCPRRTALKEIEGWREANEHTVLGDIAHEHADLPGYEIAKGVTLWCALPVWSERLGISALQLSRPACERGARIETAIAGGQSSAGQWGSSLFSVAGALGALEPKLLKLVPFPLPTNRTFGRARLSSARRRVA